MDGHHVHLDIDDEENDSDYVPDSGSSSDSDISMTSSADAPSTFDGTLGCSSKSARSDSLAPADSRSQVGRSTPPPVVRLRRAGSVTTATSNRSMSTTSEVESVFPYEALFKSLFGRKFNQSGHYMLPADGDEHSRLDMQHISLRLHLNSLYDSPELVEHVLRPGQQQQPGILDVGTGSGKWAVDMAIEFPHAQVIGLDLAPPSIPENSIPDNCRFEVDDANNDLSHWAKAFNVVHVRSVDVGMNDFHNFTYQIAQTLRPGGVLFLIFGSLQMYDENFQPFGTPDPGEPGFTWCQRVLGAAYNAYVNRGNRGIHASLRWDGWLRSNPNYRNVETRDTFIAAGPWKPNMSEREIASSNLMREDVARIMLAFKPLLLTDGHDEEEVDEWIEQATAELRGLKIRGYTKWQFTTAIRTDDPWQDRDAEVEEEPEVPRMIAPPSTRASRAPSPRTGSSMSPAATGQ